MNSDDRIQARRAIEALRSGVPNRDAVRHLGVFQGDVTQKFADLLGVVQETAASGEQSKNSLVISGGFGAGKSHLLEYLRHKALDLGFVCSHVVISKETPLSHPLKLLRAAAETAAVKGETGRAIPEILFTLKTNSEEFVQLFEWVDGQEEFEGRIKPVVKIFKERSLGSDEDTDRIAREWSGHPMKLADLRAALRAIRQIPYYPVKAVGQQDAAAQREFANQLWRFLPRLFRAAGYKGWVVLIDEVELILRYTRPQRARSYSQVARLAGTAKGNGNCGLLPVFSIVSDYWDFAEKKLNDPEEIPAWLHARGKPGDEDLARATEAGMKTLKKSLPLRGVRADELPDLQERIRQIHSLAFGWEAPGLSAAAKGASSPVREYIKSWITHWDMMLLYPDYRPQTVVDKVDHDYSENGNLARDEGQLDGELQ